MKVLLKSSARSFCYCLLLSIYLPLYGQDNLTADGGTYEIRHDNNSKFQDFIIPSDLDPASGYNQLSFYLTGGDGGKRKIQFICTEPGGNGARVTAAFAIGDGLGELKPGGTIRFIVGQEGGSITSGGLAGAGGGGGTAVLYRAPGAIMGEDCIKTYDDTNYKVPSVSWQDTTCWVLLAVAGGGGGAYAPGGCAQSSSGKPGNAGINGTDGKGITAGKGGQNGDPGSEYAVGGLDGYGGSGGGFNPRGFNRATGEYGGIEGGRGGNTHSGIRIRGGDGYGGGGVGFHIFLYVRGGGGGGYSGGGHGSQYEGGGGGGSFLNPYAIMSHSEKKDGNGTDRSPDNGRVTYRFELNADLLDAPVASCEDVTVYISGDTETLRPEDADDSSYDPNDLPLDLRIREVQDSPGDNPWSYGTHFDCSDIGNSYTYSLQADNGFSQSQCEFTVEIEQGPVSTLVCPPSITVQPFDCLPIIGENLLYHYEGEAYFPDFEPQSQPACNSQGDYYIIRPDNSIDTTQNYPINDQLYRDTFAFGTSIVIYTATYTNAEDVEETQSCAFTVTVDPVQIAPRCPDNVQVELAADGCEAEISNILPDYECGELAYRIVGPELENPSITEGTGELNSFMALPGITTFEWRLADIPVAGASCSFTVSVDERNFLDRPTFTNCPTTADPYIYDGITQEEVLEQIDFAATDDCNVTGYELKGRNGGDFSLTCDDIGNNKRMEIWAYDGSGGHSVCELIVIPRGANGVVCRDDLRVELLPDHCNNMINFSSFDLAPFGLGCNQGFTYTIRDNENVLLDSGSGPIPDQQFGRGHYMASYHWMSLEDGVIQFHDCTFIVAVEEPEPPTAVCQNLTVTLSAVPTDLAEQVGAGSSDNCDGELTYSLDLDLNCAKAGLNTAYLTVTDDSGNQSTCVTAIRVINDIAPVVTACPQNRNISLDPGSCTVTVPDLTTEIMGTIACGSFSASQFPEAGTSISGAHGTVFEVGVGLTGENGSSSSPSCTVSFTIQDVTAPVAQCTPLTVDVDNIPTDLAQQLGAGSTDSCGEIASFSLSKQTFDCDELGVHTVTLTLTDTVGNASSCSTTITVKDNTPPTVLCQDRTFYITPSSDPMSYTSTDLIASFSDNCAAAPNNVVQSWNFDCDDVGSLTRQITVSDGNGNSATCTSIVTIKDATIPVAQCKDVEVALDTKGEAVLTAAQVNNSSSDNCGISSMSLSQTTFDCTDLGPNTLVLTVSDASGNTATCTTTVTVVDNTAPTASCQNVTVQLEENGTGSLTAAQVNNNSSDNCGINSMSLSQTTFDCTDLGPNTMVLTVSDASSNASTCSATVTVVDEIAPTANCQNATVQLEENGSGSLTTIQINNNSSDNCAISSMSLSKTTFDCADLGSNTVVLTVSDASGNTSTCSATVAVVDEIAPTASCQNVTVQLEENGSGSLTAIQVNNNSSDNCAISSMSLSQTTFNCPDLGPNTVVLTVSDASGNASTCSATVAVVDEIAPTASCQNVTVQLEENGTGSLTATQVNNSSSDNCGISSMSLNQTTFGCADRGPNTVVLTVGDASGNASTCSATVTIVDEIEPTASCQSITVQLDEIDTGSLTAAQVDNNSSDNCGISSMSLNQTIFDCDDLGPNTVVLTVSDASGNTSTCSATVTIVDNTAPTASCQNVTVQLEENGSGSLTPAQVDNGSLDNCGISSMSLNQTAFDCADLGPNTLVLTVSDASGNTSTCSTTVTIVDNTAPTASCQNTTVQLEENGSGSLIAAQVNNNSSDNCGISSMSLSQTTFDCTDLGPNTVVLTVSDASGNASTCSATVTVVDEIAPTASCQNVTVQLGENGYGSLTVTQVNNNSSDNCGISSMSLSQTIFNCADLGPNTVVLTVSDASGNTSTCRAIVKVVDPLVPAISCKSNINVVLDAAGQATLLPADLITSASDNCTPTEQLRLQLIYDAGYEDFQWVNSLDLDCDDVGVMTLGVMAFDAQGNDSDPCEVEIVVQDTQAPTLSCPADITTVNDPGQCSVLIEDLPAPGSSDNCGVELMHEISYNGADEYPAYETSAESGILQERTFEVGITTIVYTAFDPSGNDVDCNFTVTVEDNENPKTRCQNLTVSLDESGRALLTTSMVDMGTTDNCTSSLALSFNPDAPKSEQYFGCDQLGNHIVPLIATDASGNQGLCIAVITVSDAGGYCRDCEPDLLLEGIIAGGVHRAAGQIEARGTVAAGTSVGLLAGEVIRLTPGFEAEAGSVFTARIAACEPIANNAAASTHEVIQIAADHTNGPGELRIYPNPFRDRFTLLYELMEEAEVEIRLVSIDGRIKQQLQRPQLQPSGTHQLEWNSPDQPAGIYFIQLRRGNIWSSQKLVKMR